jgi:hypothetical protein
MHTCICTIRILLLKQQRGDLAVPVLLSYLQRRET